jgi:hypothetical protein
MSKNLIPNDVEDRRWLLFTISIVAFATWAFYRWIRSNAKSIGIFVRSSSTVLVFIIRLRDNKRARRRELRLSVSLKLCNLCTNSQVISFDYNLRWIPAALLWSRFMLPLLDIFDDQLPEKVLKTIERRDSVHLKHQDPDEYIFTNIFNVQVK